MSEPKLPAVSEDGAPAEGLASASKRRLMPPALSSLGRPGVALFGVGVIVLSAGSAAAMGMDRYVLAVPAIFLMLAWFGRRIVFDRAWVMASTLLMGMLAMLFTFGFWVS